MNSREIDLLIQRYLDGETSLKEEEALRRFFSGPDLPERYRVYAGMFEGMNRLKDERHPDKRFRQQMLRGITKSGKQPGRRSFSFSWYLVSGVAATLILAILLLVPIDKYPVLNLFTEKVGDTFDDPQKAYAETIKVLLNVSEKLNAGTRQMEGINRFERGLKDAGKMMTLDQGSKNIGQLNKLHENTRPVRKLNKMDQGLNEAEKLSRFDENKTNNNNLKNH